MSSKAFNEAQLRTDVYFEQEQERIKQQELYDILDADQALADEWGLGGKVVGTLLGGLFGGFEGAQIGGQIGSQARFFAPEEFETSDLDFTYDEGKFGVGDLREFREDVEAGIYDYEMGEYTTAFGDLLNAYIIGSDDEWLGWGNSDSLYYKYLSPDAFEEREWMRWLEDEDESYFT